jgi:hypothetical protein
MDMIMALSLSGGHLSQMRLKVVTVRGLVGEGLASRLEAIERH